MLRLGARAAFALALSLAGSATLAAQGAVLRVDAGGGGGFTTIQAAVDAAVDGELVLVATGTYAGFTIDGKSLVVAADAGASVLIQGGATLTNVSAIQTASLVGLEMEASDICPAESALVSVVSCAGPVFLQDLNLRCEGPLFDVLFGADIDAVLVEASSSVCIVDSILNGNASDSAFLNCNTVRRALVTIDSRVFVYGSNLIGGDGDFAYFTLFGSFPARPGHEGLSQTGGSVFAVDSTIVGGDGGDGVDDTLGAGCFPGSDGAAGLRLQAGHGQPVARLINTTVAAGLRGLDDGCGTGIDGVDTEILAGSVNQIPGTGRPLTSTNVAPDQTTASVEIRGEPSEFAWIGLSNAPSSPLVIAPTLTGIVSPQVPLLDLFFTGQLDGNGELDLQFFINDFGFPHLPVYHQAYLWDGVDFRASYPQLMLILDDV